MEFKTKFDIYYSGYIQIHCQTNKEIKGADKILPEVYGTTLTSNKDNIIATGTSVQTITEGLGWSD